MALPIELINTIAALIVNDLPIRERQRIDNLITLINQYNHDRGSNRISHPTIGHIIVNRMLLTLSQIAEQTTDLSLGIYRNYYDIFRSELQDLRNIIDQHRIIIDDALREIGLPDPNLPPEIPDDFELPEEIPLPEPDNIRDAWNDAVDYMRPASQVAGVALFFWGMWGVVSARSAVTAAQVTLAAATGSTNILAATQALQAAQAAQATSTLVNGAKMIAGIALTINQ